MASTYPEAYTHMKEPLSPLHKRAHDCGTFFIFIVQMAGAMPAGALQFMAYESSKAQVLTQFACFTGAHAQILTREPAAQHAARQLHARRSEASPR